jgi:hypothetical protein
MTVGVATESAEKGKICKWLGDVQPAHDAFLDIIREENRKHGLFNSKKDPSKNYASMLLEWLEKYEPYYEIEVHIMTKNGTSIDKTEKHRNPPPYLEAFCDAIAITAKTLDEWAKTDSELRDAISRYKGVYAQIVKEGGTTGSYNARWTQFEVQNSLDWTSRSDVQSGGKPLAGFAGPVLTDDELDNAALNLVARIAAVKKDVEPIVGDPGARQGLEPTIDPTATRPVAPAE